MSVILNENIHRICGFIKTNCIRFYECRKSVKSLVFCGFSIIAIICSFLFAGATVGLKVDYDGKIIATVKSESDFETAVTLVARSVNGTNVEAAVKQPVYTTALVLNNDIDNSTEVAQAIIDNTETIVSAKAITVNGVTTACSDTEELDARITQQLNRFSPEGAECTCEFIDTVSVKDGYFLANELSGLETVCSIIENLQVRTVVNATTDVAIPFETETTQNSSMLRGDSNIVTAGVNGTQRVTESITYINGVEASRETVSAETVAEPVTQVVEVGTARSIVSAKDKKVAQSSGFLFPLPSRGWTVSAYYGDGRNHGAIDLACNKGTSIYAVKAGRVVSAGWDGNYGLSIVIDHGNGLKTRYAHESEIYVNVGDTVSAGEEIGTVGRTGNASGNHLHFEVIVNGNRVDPAPYIGLD